MNEPFEQLIDNLENKLANFLASNSKLKQEYQLLKQVLEQQKAEKAILVNQIEDLKHQNSLLKNANALLGSDEYKKETKLKINALVKEIDQCIAQLT